MKHLPVTTLERTLLNMCNFHASDTVPDMYIMEKSNYRVEISQVLESSWGNWHGMITGDYMEPLAFGTLANVLEEISSVVYPD